MKSCSARGFTLIEVMGAVLILGLLFTWLASVAMIGLRSEGTDRRRADAELLADLELTTIEASVTAGQMPKDGRSERDEEAFRVLVEVAPTDVLSLLPAPLARDIAQKSDPRAPSVLLVERGQSRVRRVSVVVEWDEAGNPAQVERTTFAYDKSELAEYFPSEQAAGNAKGKQPEDPMQELMKGAPPELQGLMGGKAQKTAPKVRPPRPSR
jgi:prepilin-type N-terminal cleavage/methylation domain-containing protein